MTATEGAGRPVPPAVLDELKAIVGPAGYIDNPKDIEPYCKAWRGGWTGKTPLVVRPATTAEVAAVVRVCAAHSVPIVPQGGNTGLTGASQPFAHGGEILISTQRMNRIRALDIANDTITVESGVVLKALQQAAADADRLFPLSLGAEGSCQIGGNISTNAGGNQVLRYGNMRALVLGLEVVMPDGRVWDGLRGLRKDNTGYDMKQLFIGGEGTLGIITAAVLRLFPKPKESQSAFIGLKSPEAAVALLGRLREVFGETISAFELMRRSILDLLLAGVPGHADPLADRHEWYVLMEVSGQGAPGSLHAPLSEALAGAMEAGLVDDAIVAASGDQARKLWRMREDLAQAQLSAGGSIAHDVSVPLSRIAEFVATADAALLARYPEVRHCCFGHVGDGNLHYNPVKPLAWSAARFMAEREAINRIVHDLVVGLGGSISAEHGIGRYRLAENEHYKSPVELDMMRAVKRALDPKGIMNPGKTVR